MERVRKCVLEIKDRVEESDELNGVVNVKLEDDGFTVRWVTKGPPWRQYARRYDLEGKSRGEPVIISPNDQTE